MTRCCSLGCREEATTSRQIVMEDGRIISAEYCASDAATYDLHLAQVKEWGAEQDAQRDRMREAINGR